MSFYDEFRKIGIDCNPASTGKAKVVCPKCRDRKGPGLREKDLSLNFETGAYYCHSGNCNWQGYAKEAKREYSRPEWKNQTALPANVVKYFESRGISQKTLSSMKVTADSHGNIEFNYFREQELINVKTRYERNGEKTFKQHSGAEKIFYNISSIAGKKKCIIVEGEMDVLSWVEAGVGNEYGVVSVDQGAPSPGQKSDGKLECLTNCANEIDSIKEFYICTDADAPGQYLRDELIRRLGAHRCYIVKLPSGAKDANQVLDRRGDNPYTNETANGSLRLCLSQSTPVPLPGIHVLDGDQKENMLDIFRKGRERGKLTHFFELDDLFTYLRGEVTLVTGLPGDGKSQFMRQLALVKSAIDGWKWACFVPEDFPVDYFYEDLCHSFIGKGTDKVYSNRMTESEFIEAMNFVSEHFFCIYPEPNEETGETPLPTNQWINQRINFLKLKYGVNAYIKDPWNKIMHDFGQREDLYLAAELSREKFFASQFDAAFYIAHPTKMHKNGDGAYPCPTPYDVSGGAMWNNMMDNCITVYRPDRWIDSASKKVEFHTYKIKKQKLVGKLGKVEFEFDIVSNRYFLNERNPLHRAKMNIVNIEAEGFDPLKVPQNILVKGVGDSDKDIPF